MLLYCLCHRLSWRLLSIQDFFPPCSIAFWEASISSWTQKDISPKYSYAISSTVVQISGDVLLLPTYWSSRSYSSYVPHFAALPVRLELWNRNKMKEEKKEVLCNSWFCYLQKKKHKTNKKKQGHEMLFLFASLCWSHFDWELNPFYFFLSLRLHSYVAYKDWRKFGNLKCTANSNKTENGDTENVTATTAFISNRMHK